MNDADAAPRLITCILPKGTTRGLLLALKQEKGNVSANVNFARGTGRTAYRAFHSGISETEKEVLQVVVSAERADEVFAFLYERAGIDRPHAGLMYQARLSAASEFHLPDLPEEH